MTVRKHAGWLSQTDERILELLDARGGMRRPDIRHELSRASPTLERPAKTIEYRCSVLLTHGMIARDEDGRYTLTRVGKGFLEGRIDAERIDETKDRISDIEGVSIRAVDDEHWICPDCRWIGQKDTLERDAEDEPICPVCGNDTEYIV